MQPELGIGEAKTGKEADIIVEQEFAAGFIATKRKARGRRRRADADPL